MSMTEKQVKNFMTLARLAMAWKKRACLIDYLCNI